MCSVLEVERKNARSGGERKDFTQRARRWNTESTEKKNPRAQPGMAVPPEAK
jgi:hypothetical protein